MTEMKVNFFWDAIGGIIFALILLFFIKGDELLCEYAKAELYAYEQCASDSDCFMNYADYSDYYNSEKYEVKYCDGN